MKDLNYFPLDVESNIYSMTTLEFEDKTNKLLVATLDCRIFCIDYNKFKPHTRDVEFTYIPSGAKIISIASLKRGPNDFAIGITHSLSPSIQKQSTRTSIPGFSSRETNAEYGRLITYYLNVYVSSSIVGNEFDLDQVAQGCQTIRLRYVPYHLFQTQLIMRSINGKGFDKKPFWLLSGGDNAIHAICEDKPYQSFTELPIEDCFPELNNIQGLALWIDMLNIETGDNYERLTALGLEDGSVKLYHSAFSTTNNSFELLKLSSFDEYTTIIPSVRLFRIESTYKSKLSDFFNSHREPTQKISDKINLLAVSSTNASIIFEDVLNQGLNSRYELPNSQRVDCSVASAIGDTNLDGFNELLIGTYGRELLTFAYDQNTDNYQLKHVMELNQPIFSISIFNLTGDILKETIIMLVNGILIMQANVEQALTICRRRVNTLLSMIDN